jgi:hypothetical protein
VEAIEFAHDSEPAPSANGYLSHTVGKTFCVGRLHRTPTGSDGLVNRVRRADLAVCKGLIYTSVMKMVYCFFIKYLLIEDTMLFIENASLQPKAGSHQASRLWTRRVSPHGPLWTKATFKTIGDSRCLCANDKRWCEGPPQYTKKA